MRGKAVETHRSVKPINIDESKTAEQQLSPEPLKALAGIPDDNLNQQWPGNHPAALNRSTNQSMSAKSLTQMSDRTMDRLERANQRLNEKMLKASIAQNK